MRQNSQRGGLHPLARPPTYATPQTRQLQGSGSKKGSSDIPSTLAWQGGTLYLNGRLAIEEEVERKGQGVGGCGGPGV